MKLLDHTLTKILENEVKMEQYLQQYKEKPSMIDPIIWQVHVSVPAKKRMKVLNIFLEQLFKKYKGMYCFLPDHLVLAKVYKTLNLPISVETPIPKSSAFVDFMSQKKFKKQFFSSRINRYTKIYNTVHKIEENFNDLGLYEYNEGPPGPFVPYKEFRNECKDRKHEKVTAEDVLHHLSELKYKKPFTFEAISTKTESLVNPVQFTVSKNVVKQRTRASHQNRNEKKIGKCFRRNANTQSENKSYKLDAAQKNPQKVTTKNSIGLPKTLSNSRAVCSTNEDKIYPSKRNSEPLKSLHINSYLYLSKIFSSPKSLKVVRTSKKHLDGLSTYEMKNDKNCDQVAANLNPIALKEDLRNEDMNANERFCCTVDYNAKDCTVEIGKTVPNKLTPVNTEPNLEQTFHNINFPSPVSEVCQQSNVSLDRTNCKNYSANLIAARQSNTRSIPQRSNDVINLPSSYKESFLPGIPKNNTTIETCVFLEETEAINDPSEETITDLSVNLLPLNRSSGNLLSVEMKSNKESIIAVENCDESSFWKSREHEKNDIPFILLNSRKEDSPSKCEKNNRDVNVVNYENEKTVISDSENSNMNFQDSSLVESAIITQRSNESEESTINENSSSSAVVSSNLSQSERNVNVENDQLDVQSTQERKRSYFENTTQSKPMLCSPSRSAEKTKTKFPAFKKAKNTKSNAKVNQKMVKKLTDFVAYRIRKRTSSDFESDQINSNDTDGEAVTVLKNSEKRNYAVETQLHPDRKHRKLKKLFNEVEELRQLSQDELEENHSVSQSTSMIPNSVRRVVDERHSDSESSSGRLSRDFETLSLTSINSSVLFPPASSSKVSQSSITKKLQTDAKHAADNLPVRNELTWDRVREMLKDIPMTEGVTQESSSLNFDDDGVSPPAYYTSLPSIENKLYRQKLLEKRGKREFQSDSSDDDVFRSVSFRSLPNKGKQKSASTVMQQFRRGRSSTKENIEMTSIEKTYRRSNTKFKPSKKVAPIKVIPATPYKMSDSFPTIEKSKPSDEKVSGSKTSYEFGLFSDDDYESDELDSALNDTLSQFNRSKDNEDTNREDAESTISQHYDDEIQQLLNEYAALNAEQKSTISHSSNSTSFESTVKNSNSTSRFADKSSNSAVSTNGQNSSTNYKTIMWNSYPDSLETALTTADEKLEEVRNSLRERFSDSSSQQQSIITQKRKLAKDNQYSSFSFLDWD